MTITEKVAYLKGLAEGLAIDTEKSKEGKLIGVIIDILEDMGLSIEDLEDTVGALDEDLDALDEELCDLEDDIYGDEDEDECDCCCDDDEDFFQVECPNCGEPLDIDEEILDIGVIQCPACKQKFVMDLFDEDECGCGCGCEDDHCETPVEVLVEEPKKPAKKSTKKADK